MDRVVSTDECPITRDTALTFSRAANAVVAKVCRAPCIVIRRPSFRSGDGRDRQGEGECAAPGGDLLYSNGESEAVRVQVVVGFLALVCAIPVAGEGERLENVGQDVLAVRHLPFANVATGWVDIGHRKVRHPDALRPVADDLEPDWIGTLFNNPLAPVLVPS